MNGTEYYFADFTEENYSRLMDLALDRFRFISFSEYKEEGNNLILRHDVDISPQRCLAIAKIEQRKGIKSTYLFYPHSPFYNMFELKISRCIQEIHDLGHDIGLHVDLGYFTEMYPAQDFDESYFQKQKEYVEHVFRFPLTAVSFHQPGYRSAGELKQICYAGLINAYAQEITDQYTYCSDSNGYWRFRRLEDVLRDPLVQRLQLLTHPGLWTKDIRSPASRIKRAIDGRSAAVWDLYCYELKMSQRINVGAEEFGK